MLVGGLVHLARLDTSAHLKGRTLVIRGGVAGIELNILQPVGPDGEGASAGRLAAEVVTGVLDDEAKVHVAGKVDGDLDLHDVGGLDGVDGETAEGAGTGRVGGGRASIASQ